MSDLIWNRVGKPVYYSVRDKVYDNCLGFVIKPIEEQIGTRLWNEIWSKVSIGVAEKVKDPVANDIENQIREIP